MNEKVKRYCQSDNLPMHMPGHKRNPEVISSEFLCDITEISGFDNLHNPTGIINEINTKAKRIWNSKSAYISVNGSSALLMSAIMAATGSAPANHNKVLVASNCHVSVWRGLELSGAEFMTFDPEFMSLGFYGSVDSSKLEMILNNNPDIGVLIYTSPTYEGIMSDCKAIYDLAQRHKITVILDEAHGAHLNAYEENFGYIKADIVIKSLHKTLNSPTQTAVLLNYTDKIPERILRHYVNCFQSTSPSYVLMSGIDSCLKSLSESDIKTWENLVIEAKAELKSLTKLSLAEFEGSDFSKIIILTNGVVSGFKLADILRDNYKIEVEAAYSGYIIAMTGIGDTKKSLKRFTDALLEIDNSLSDYNTLANQSKNEVSYTEGNRTICLGIREAMTRAAIPAKFSEAIDKISSEYIFAYPPGIPIVIPGEKISAGQISALEDLIRGGSELKLDPFRPWDDTVLTVDMNGQNQV